MSSAFSTSFTWLETAPEPMPSSSAATDEAWHRRVQWSTLLVPKPVRTSFWKRYASSFEPLAEPKPASALRSSSRTAFSPSAAFCSAVSQETSSNTSFQFAGSAVNVEVFGKPGFLISGLVKRCGCAA